MKKILHFLDNIERNISVLALVAMLIIVFWQVVLRFVFNSANSWSEELARYLHVMLVYISCGYATRMREHIKIDAFMNIYPKRLRPLICRLGELVFLAFCAVIIYYGIKQSASIFAMGRISSALKISMGIVYLMLPIGYSFTAIRLVQNWIIDITKHLSKQAPDEGGRL